MSRVIYTIGYQRIPSPDALAELAETLDLTVVDIRGRPTSRKSGFGRRQLASFLGSRYQWRGDQLGGIYHLKDAQKLWPAASRRLVEDVAGGLRPLLLCQCHAPGQCHRHQVSLEILRQSVARQSDRRRQLVEIVPQQSDQMRVVHIYEDETVDAAELERSLQAGPDAAYSFTGWEELQDIRAAWER